jgi:hypothetical protein
MSGVEQSLHHATAHDAETDKTEIRHQYLNSRSSRAKVLIVPNVLRPNHSKFTP